jgi:hypothetical protein
MPETIPAGFRRSVDTGLILPETLSRAREVWSKDDFRQLDKLTKFIEAKGLLLFLGCPQRACRETPIERMRRIDGGITLRCAHLDRDVVKL